MFCNKCGEKLIGKAKFCPFCGTKNYTLQATPDSTQEQKQQQSLRSPAEVERLSAPHGGEVKRKSVLFIVIGCVIAAVLIIFLTNPFGMIGHIQGTYYHTSAVPFGATLDFDGNGRWEMNRGDIYITGTYKQRTLFSDKEYILVSDWWEAHEGYSDGLVHPAQTVKLFIKILDKTSNTLEGKAANEASMAFLQQSIWTFDRLKYTDSSINEIEDRILFGTWRGQPIEWRVLDIENDRAMLISEDILTIMQYDRLESKYISYIGDDTFNWSDVNIIWKNSDIRLWLNEVFYCTAFSKSEQERVLTSEIANEIILLNGYDANESTMDKVFLLSTEEVFEYFEDDDDRIARFYLTDEEMTYLLQIDQEEYGYDQDDIQRVEKELREDYLNKSMPWWWRLRSPVSGGFYGSSLASESVFTRGDVGVEDVYGDGFVSDLGGVRPALYIKLTS